MSSSFSSHRLITFLTAIAWTTPGVHGLSELEVHLHQSKHVGRDTWVNIDDRGSLAMDKLGSKRMMRSETQDQELQEEGAPLSRASGLPWEVESGHAAPTPGPPMLVKWKQDPDWCLAVNKTNTSNRIGLEWCGRNAPHADVMRYMKFKLPPPGETGVIQWDNDVRYCVKVHQGWIGNGDFLNLHKCDNLDVNATHGMKFHHTGGKMLEHGHHRQTSAFEWDCDHVAAEELGRPSSCVKCVDVFYEYNEVDYRIPHQVNMWDRTNADAQLWRVEEST